MSAVALVAQRVVEDTLVRMCISIYIYIYTYIHTYIHVYIHIYIHTHMHMSWKLPGLTIIIDQYYLQTNIYFNTNTSLRPMLLETAVITTTTTTIQDKLRRTLYRQSSRATSSGLRSSCARRAHTYNKYHMKQVNTHSYCVVCCSLCLAF